MSVLIGLEHPDRHACTDEVHLPNCYNPGSGLTACACGDVWWVGRVGVWHSAPLRAEGRTTSTGRYVSGEIVGWDRYFLHLPGCLDERVVPPSRHVCGGAVGTTHAEAVRAIIQRGPA